MNTAYVALGANLGDPASTVRAAFGALANLPESRITRCSSLYRTTPVGIAEQPDFINAVVALATTLAPETLLDELLELESRFGRQRAEKNGPRTLDLDLLLYNDIFLDLPAFVLQPLAEIAPDLQIPGRGGIGAWLPAVANQGIARL
jgi:2-amino-4-hydroxy-6-hydroxymethyldihydropteridine diphosphokinase